MDYNVIANKLIVATLKAPGKTQIVDAIATKNFLNSMDTVELYRAVKASPEKFFDAYVNRVNKLTQNKTKLVLNNLAEMVAMASKIKRKDLEKFNSILSKFIKTPKGKIIHGRLKWSALEFPTN